MAERIVFVALMAMVVSCRAFAVEVSAGFQIVIPNKQESRVYDSLRTAAETLRDCIRESVGFELPVRTAAEAKTDVRSFWIGETFAAKTGVLPADFKALDNGIVCRNDDVYLFGRDRSVAPKAHHWHFDVLSSVRATTRFMEKFAGARFVMPGEVGREYAKRERILIPDGHADLERPFFEYDCRQSSATDLIYCQANGFVGYGGYHTYGGHTYPSACPQSLLATHPEYFALRGGQRRKGPTVSQQALCISNPEVEEMIVREIERRLDDGADVCELGQNDGNVVCECDNCTALFGTGNDWGEKVWLFHRRIAERIHRERPGKRVMIMSYDATWHPPKTFKEFPPNVMIELCGFSEDYLAEWVGYKVPHGFTCYIYSWGNYQFLGYTAKRSFAGCVRQQKLFRSHGIKGIYRCGYGELYGVEGAQYYVFNRLSANPCADVSELLDEYCQGAFGNAAGHMRAFYLALDKRLRAHELLRTGISTEARKSEHDFADALPENQLDLIGYIYAPSAVEDMDGCLLWAEQTPGLTEKQRKRLALVRMEFDYAKNLGRIATFYAAYRTDPTEATFAPLGDAILERNAMLDRLFDDKASCRRELTWPGVALFGGDGRKMVQTNGRLEGTIGDPLDWDVMRLRQEGILPGASHDVAKWRKYNAERQLRPLTGWRRKKWCSEPERDDVLIREGGAAFTLVGGKGKDVGVVTSFNGEMGMKPGMRYRLSWFARLDGITAYSATSGFFAAVHSDRYPAYVKEPSGRPLKGSSGWVRQSIDFTTCARTDFTPEIEFRIWNASGRVEVSDVMVECLSDDREADERKGVR